MNVVIKERLEQIRRGDIPEGYKKSSLGIIPDSWKDNTFDNLFSFEGGLGIPRNELSDEGVPYLHYGDMHTNEFSSVSVEQYKKEPKYNVVLKGNEKYLLKDGDVVFLDASEDLFGTSRSVVVSNNNNEFFISGLHTIIAKEKSKEVTNEYKRYITQPFEVKKQFAKYANGFKVYGLNRQTFKKITIHYPININEQNAIANMLIKWDKVLEIQKNRVEKLEKQRKAVCQRLLTQKKDWKEIQLIRNLKYSFERVGDKIIEPVAVGVFGIRKRSEIFSKELSKDYSKNLLFKKNQICFGMGTNKIVYDVLLTNDTFCVSPAYNVFDVEDMDPYFLKLLLDSKNKYLSKKYMIVSARQGKAVHLGGLLKEKFKVPNKSEQIQISNYIFLFDKKVELETKKLELLNQQRKSMMQLLLSGLVRCV